MFDFAKNALVVGDKVAYLPPNYRHLISGTVIGFTPKMIVIERYKSADEIRDYEIRYRTKYTPTIDRREHGYVAKIGKVNAE